MHARPNNTGPKTTLACLTLMPVAALRAEGDGVGTLGPPAVEAGPVGATIVGTKVPEPM
jgi:hypothetical protein